MRTTDIISLLALIIVPIVCVLIGQYLQDRSNKRKDKMDVFKSIMTFRYGWSKEGVEALNCIPIVFSSNKKDKEVRECWKKYYEWLCVQNPDEMQIKQRNDALFKLLLSMAQDLGYKETITWEDIQNPYIPMVMAESINNNEIIQKGMAAIVQTLTFAPKMHNNSVHEEKNFDTNNAES